MTVVPAKSHQPQHDSQPFQPLTGFQASLQFLAKDADVQRAEAERGPSLRSHLT
jgi:hypothetical protein